MQNTMDDYEGSYGSQIEEYYKQNRDQLKKQYKLTPEKLAQGLFKAGKEVSDGDSYDTWAKRHKMDRFSQNISDFEAKEQQSLLDEQERTKNLAERGDFMRGVHSGVDQLQAAVGGGVLMGLGKLASYAGGDNVVSKYLTNKGFDVYQEQMRQASLNPTKSLLSEEEGKWVNEDLKSIGDYGDAIAGTLGNLVPSMAVSLLSGGVGGKMAEYIGRKSVDKAVGYFVKNQAERMLNKGMFSEFAKEATGAAVKTGVAREAALMLGEEAARKVAQVAAHKYVGSRVGTILGTAVLESTGAFADTVDHMRQKFLDEGMSPEAALLKATDEASATFAMSTGLAAGMVEIFGGNIRLLDMILGDMGGKTAKQLVAAATHARANPGLRGKALNMMRDIMVEAAKQAPAEFGQEAIQEILSMSNINFADPDFEMVSQENFKQVLGAGLAGAIGGMGGGMATQVGSKARAAFGTTETPESRAKALEVQIARQEDMLARGLDRSMPGLAKALEENKAELGVLRPHLDNVSVGLSYKEAAAKIASELPSPDNKPFTVKSLRNLIRHGNLEESEKGTVKAESLEAFITSRKAQPETTTQTSQEQPSVNPSMTTMTALNVPGPEVSDEPSWLQDGPPPDDEEGNGPRFSRATRDFEGPGLGRDRVTEHLTKSGLADVANVFESTEELDEGTREMLKTREAENSPAFWHGGRLHVNAARVQDDDHAADLIAHEIIHPAEEAHVAELAKKLGAEEAVNEWNGTLDKVYSSFTAEIESLAKDRGYEKDYDLSTDAGRRGIAGELLADKNIKGTEKFYDKAVTVLKKIVNSVRKAMGLKEMDLGESEIRVLLSKMKESYAGQAAKDTRFAREKKDNPRMTMNYRHDGEKHVMRDDLLNHKNSDGKPNPITTTAQAIWEGKRTATTRRPDEIDKMKLAPGKKFYVEEDGMRLQLQVEGIVPVSSMTAEEWSAREGWAPQMYAQYVGEGKEAIRGLKEVDLNSRKAYELDDKQKARYNEKRDVIVGETLDELPLDYQQIRFKVLSKEKVALPDAGLTTEQKAELKTEQPASVNMPKADKSKTFEYTEEMQAEDKADVAKESLKKAGLEPLESTPFEKVVDQFLLNAADWVQDKTRMMGKPLATILLEKRQAKLDARNKITDKTQEELLSRLRALPVRRKLRLLASAAPKDFHKALTASREYTLKVAADLTKAMETGNTAPILSGDVRRFLNGAWSLAMLHGSARDVEFESRSKVIKNGKLSDADKTAALRKLRDDRAKELTKQIKEVSDAVTALSKQITGKDSAVKAKLEASYGPAWRDFVEGIEEDAKELKAFAGRFSETRKSMLKHARPYWENRVVSTPSRLALLEYEAITVTQSLPFTHFTKVQERVDEAAREVRQELNLRPGMRSLSADAKAMYADMVGQLVAVASYTNKVGAANRQLFDSAVDQLRSEVLSNSAVGALTPNMAEGFLSALSNVHENRKEISAEHKERIEKIYQTAAILRGTAVTGAAWYGGPNPAAIGKFSTPAEFVGAVRELHQETLKLFEDMGIITRSERTAALAFPGTGNFKGNQLAAKNFKAEATAADSFGQGEVRRMLGRLNKAYNGKINILENSLFPSFTMLFDDKGGQVHELTAMRSKIDQLIKEKGSDGTFAGLTPDELMLGLIGVSHLHGKGAFKNPSIQNIPEALGKKMVAAGFAAKFEKGSVAYDVARYVFVGDQNRDDASFELRSLFNQMEFKHDARTGAFFSRDPEKNLNLTPADGKFADLRSVRPGSVLYSEAHNSVFVVTGLVAESAPGARDARYTVAAPKTVGQTLVFDIARNKQGIPFSYSQEELFKEGLSVVPRVWELLPGFTKTSVNEKNVKVETLEVVNSFELGNALRVMDEKARIKEVARSTNNPDLMSAAYAKSVTDAQGRQYLVTFNHDSESQIYEITSKPSQALNTGAVIEDVLGKVSMDPVFIKSIKKMEEMDPDSDGREIFYHAAASRVEDLLATMQAATGMTDAQRDAIQTLVLDRLEERFESASYAETLERVAGMMPVLEEESSATFSKKNTEDTDNSFEDDGADSGIGTSLSSELIPDDVVGKILFTEESTVEKDTVKRGMALRSQTLNAARENLEAKNKLYTAYANEARRLRGIINKVSEAKNWKDAVIGQDALAIASAYPRLELLNTKIIPQAVKEVQAAEKTLEWATEIMRGDFIYAQAFATSGLDAIAPTDVQTETNTLEAVRDSMMNAVLDFELDPAKIKSGFMGYFSALPREQQAAAHALYFGKESTISAQIASGQLPKTLRGLMDAKAEDLAIYILAGMAASRNLYFETGEKLTNDMARVAYALAIRDLPLATTSDSMKPLSQMSERDQKVAKQVMFMAPILIAYNQEYKQAAQWKKNWTADTMWDHVNQSKPSDDLVLMLNRTGLSRLFDPKDPDTANLADGFVTHKTDELDVLSLVRQIATHSLPSDIGLGMLGETVEAKREFLDSIELRDRTKQSANFPNPISLTEVDFQRQLAESLAGAILQHWPHGDKWMQHVAVELDSVLENLEHESRKGEKRISREEFTLTKIMDVIRAKHDADPEAVLVAFARFGLNLDASDNFMVRTLDDIRSFHSPDGLTQYTLQTENERLANTEEYPPLPETTISGGDYMMMMLINDIAPGTYDLTKINLATNTGRSKTLTVGGREGGVEFGERTLTAFGEALVQSVRRTHEDLIRNNATARPTLKKILRKILEWSAAAQLWGDGMIDKLVGRYRQRHAGVTYKLQETEEPSMLRVHQFATNIITELEALTGLNIEFVLHPNGETAADMLNRIDLDRSALPQDLLLAVELAESGKGAKATKAQDLLKNIMGYRDRHGRVHLFIGAHASADGTFDWQELAKTVYHEAVGHIGLRQVLGAEYDNFMVSVAKRQFGEGRTSRWTRELQIMHAEEFMSTMAEDVRQDAAAGRPVNKNLATGFDQLAAMLARAFRKLMKKLGFDFHTTASEMRVTLSKAFAGSKVAGRSGLSSFISPSLISGENLTSPGEFGQYAANLMDTMMLKFADYLGRWEMLNRATLNAGQALTGDQDAIGAMRTQKSRIGAMALIADALQKKFTNLFKSNGLSRADAGDVSRALSALERNVESSVNNEISRGKLKTEASIEAYRAKVYKNFRNGGYTKFPASNVSNAEIKEILDRHIALGHLTENSDGTWGGKVMEPVNLLIEMNKVTLSFAEAAGMVSAESAAKIRDRFRYYVPITGSSPFEKGTAEYFALTGGDRFKAPGESAFMGMPMEDAERDSVGLTISGLRTRIHEAGVNKTNNAIYNFASRLHHGNPDLFNVYMSQEELADLQDSMSHLSLEGFEQYMVDNGIRTMPQIPENLSRQELKEFEQVHGLIPVYRNGQLRYFRIVDEGLAKGFDILNNPKQAGRVMRMLGIVNRWLIKMNTSMNPEFFIPNMVRDASTALNTLSIRENVVGLDGKAFAKEVLKNVPGAMKVLYANNFGKDKSGFSETQKELDALVKDFELTGAKIQWAFMETPEQIAQNLDAAINVAQGKGSFKENGLAFTSAVEEFMRKSSDVFENATRLAVFAAAIKNGSTKEQAALMAREITVDFDRKGEWGQALNTLYMFANAGIQGTLTIFRTMRNNPARAAKHVSAIVGMSFSVALMNMFLGGDGDDGEPAYFAVNDEVRNGNLVIMLPGMEKGVRIPLPYGYAFFWSIGQEMVASAFGRRSSAAAAGGVMGAFLNNFNPLETAASLNESHGWLRMLSPTITDPLVDIGFEKTPFGTPLMPQKAYDDQPDSARHWRSVSESSKAVAQWLNNITGGSGATEGAISISPETLDLLIETTFGGTGKFLSRVSGLAFAPFSAKEFTENDLPIARRFATGVMQWEDRAKFKSAYDEIHGVNRTMRTLQENIGMARVPELRAEASKDAAAFRAANQDILSTRVVVNNVYNRVKTIDKQKERLYKSGLSESVIQPQLKALNERQKKIYQDFNRRYYEMIDAR